MEDRRKAKGNPPLTPQERERLFDQFKGWAAERPELWQKGNDEYIVTRSARTEPTRLTVA
jgi:hypothetical protein